MKSQLTLTNPPHFPEVLGHRYRRYFSVTISTTEISVVMLQPSDDKASFLYKAGRQLGFILEKSQEQVQKQNLPFSSASFSG